ncbi:MAG: choice-of-anchor V domain-containing protein [Chitinophagaceae bacterium]|jgi:hypothetical protein
MIKRVLLFSAAIGITYLGISSYAAGPGTASLNRTGSDGVSATCSGSGCHGASSTATQVSVEVKEKITGAVVTGNYIPGKLYIVRVYGECNIPPLRPKFGFQAAVTKADKTTAGTLRKISGTNTDIRTVSGQSIMEHTSPLDATPSAGFYSVNFEWIAPPKGTGKITFYAILNAVDGTGTTDKDLPSVGKTASFEEGFPTLIEENNLLSKVSIYPNPSVQTLNIQIDKNTDFSATIFDLAGRKIIASKQQNSIDVSSLSPGIYTIQIGSGNTFSTKTFIKE